MQANLSYKARNAPCRAYNLSGPKSDLSSYKNSPDCFASHPGNLYTMVTIQPFWSCCVAQPPPAAAVWLSPAPA